MTKTYRAHLLACLVLLLTVQSTVLAVPMPDHAPDHADKGTVGSSKPGMGLFSFDRLFQRLMLRVMAQSKPKPGNGNGNGKPSTSTHSGYTPKPSESLSTSGTKTGSASTPTGSSSSTSIKPTNGTSTTDASTTSEKPSTTAGTPIADIPALPTQCPAGFKYVTWIDDFTVYDDQKWDWQDGAHDDQVTFDDKGVTMTVNKTAYNIAYQSTPMWIAPVQMALQIKSSDAPAVVSSAMFRNGCTKEQMAAGSEACSDEIDLELIKDTAQLPLWQLDASKVDQVEIPPDASENISSPWKRLRKYVYSGPTKPHDGIHEWTVNWDKDEIEWFCDKKPVVSYGKTDNAKLWPKQAMHIRYGLWAVTQSDWAEGNIDWQKYPAPTQQMTKITVTGCMKDA